MLGRQQGDHGASAELVREFLQCIGDARHEAFVGVAEREAELGRGLELGVGEARVVERPLQQLYDEIAPERGKGRALRASQHDDHGGAVAQAVVEQLSG